MQQALYFVAIGRTTTPKIFGKNAFSFLFFLDAKGERKRAKYLCPNSHKPWLVAGWLAYSSSKRNLWLLFICFSFFSYASSSSSLWCSQDWNYRLGSVVVLFSVVGNIIFCTFSLPHSPVSFWWSQITAQEIDFVRSLPLTECEPRRKGVVIIKKRHWGLSFSSLQEFCCCCHCIRLSFISNAGYATADMVQSSVITLHFTWVKLMLPHSQRISVCFDRRNPTITTAPQQLSPLSLQARWF